MGHPISSNYIFSWCHFYLRSSLKHNIYTRRWHCLCLIKGTLSKEVVGEDGRECEPRRDRTDHITAKEVRGWVV